ncbi:hypothetical protein [Corallococcus sp. RDP092CA]
MEILSIATGQQVLCQHHEGLNENRLLSLLDGLVKRMLAEQ